jgi:hypothetical protein
MRTVPLILALVLVAAACSAGSTTAIATETAEGRDGPAFGYETVDYELEPVGSALRGDRGRADFPPPVVDPDDIVRGGPPPDGIPPIDDPVFVSIADVDFIDDDNEGVVVVEVNGEAKAYPVRILIWHEIVNDEIGGVPVTVTYCPLCNSALVFERQLGDRLLDFGTSGELYQSALVMYDRQTESLWAHFTGQGLVGHYAGAQLELVPAQTLGFASFVDAFPDGTVLTPETGFSRPYGQNPYVGYDDASTNPIGGFISQPIDDRFGAKDRVVGIVAGTETFAIVLEDLRAVGVAVIENGDRPIVVFHREGLNSSLEERDIAAGRDVGQTGAFIALAPDGTRLTFRSAEGGFTDAETGSVWSVSGRATEGRLVGADLEAVPIVDTFWFSWSTYQPDHTLIDP